MLNQCRDAVIEAMGLEYQIWKECEILSATIKYDGSAIASASFSARSELLQASITTKYLKVLDGAIDQVQLEEICNEALLILDGGRSMFE